MLLVMYTEFLEEQTQRFLVMTGSHIDSVLRGGNYDGIGGVVCSWRLQDRLLRWGLEQEILLVPWMKKE